MAHQRPDHDPLESMPMKKQKKNNNVIETQIVNLNFFALLPPQVISNITAKLPLKSIAKCLLVCKLWLNVLSNPVVAKGLVQFLFFSRHTNAFAVLDDDPVANQIKPGEVIKLKTPGPMFMDMYGVHSCNGLVCLPAKNNTLLYLLNPVTGESALVPEPLVQGHYAHIYDLGYCPNTDKFKITRFVRRTYNDETTALEILTLGVPGGWRTFPGEVPDQIWNKSEPATFSKGVLHWLVAGKKKAILTFDLEEERFGSVPPPALDDNKEVYKMGFIDNCLVVTAGHNPPLGLEIWARRDCVWTKNWVIDAQDSLSQNKIYVTKLMLLIPRKVSNDGRVFLSYMDEQLLCYDPEKRVIEDYVFTVNDEAETRRSRYSYQSPLSPWPGVIPYTASLVSPKALIEAGGDTKRRKDKGKQKVVGTV